MAPPKKPGHQRASSNPFKSPFKKNSNKMPDPDEEYYQAKTKFVSKESDNRIGGETIAKQLANAPNPKDTGKSGYPHKFLNTKGQIAQLVRTDSAASSTTSLYEYPVLSDGRDYDYQSKKPKDNPGNIRGITNQNKRLKGVLAHDGKNGNPNRGPMHWVEKEVREK